MILSSQSASAQAPDMYFDWVKTLSTSGSDITMDSAGNTYMAGTFSGITDVDPSPNTVNITSAGLRDIFIAKYDSYGSFMWVKQLGGVGDDFAQSVTIDGSGNIYAMGAFANTVDFDPGSGVANITATLKTDMFILKLDKQGSYVWAKNVGGTNSVFGSRLTVDAGENVYTTGNFSGTIDFDPGPAVYSFTAAYSFTPAGGRDMFVYKLDKHGNLVWARQLKSTTAAFNSATDLALDGYGNVYTTGRFYDAVDFDPGPAFFTLAATNRNAYVLKLDNNGNFIWVKQLGLGGSAEAGGITIDKSGNVLSTGEFSTGDFDPGVGEFKISGDFLNTYISKLTNNGDFIWAKVLSGYCAGRAIKTDNFGNVYTTGDFISQIDMDPSQAVYSLSGSGYNGFLSKLDSAGNFAWGKQIGKGSSYVVSSNVIFNRSTQELLVSGKFSSTADFDPGPSTFNLTNASTISQLYILKLKPSCVTVDTSFNISTCKSFTLNTQTYTQSGNYTQITKSIAGCDSIIRLALKILTPISIPIDTTICQGNSFLGHKTTGIYADTLRTINGCDSIITNTKLTVTPLPKPFLGNDTSFCKGASVVLNPGVFSSYKWKDQSINAMFEAAFPGKYWVTVTENNCTASDTISILKVHENPSRFLPASYETCNLPANVLVVPGYRQYTWGNGAIADRMLTDHFGSYSLTVIDSNNCVGSDSFTIRQKTNCIQLAVPNAFSPNGDGKNELFRPIINQVASKYQFIIYNRFGQRIFSTSDTGKSWDGRFKGLLQQSGTYIYKISFVQENGTAFQTQGAIVLIR